MTDAWRADAVAWWDSVAWHDYEKAYGDQPGDRTRLLQAADWSTRVLDITPEPIAILRRMRKGRRSEIAAGLKRWTPFGATALSWAMDAYVDLHQAVYRMPRPPLTYTIQAQWVDAGTAHPVALASRGGHGIEAAALFIIFGTWAYYASSVTTTVNATATAVWTGVLECKRRGVTTLELGWQGYASDAKGQAVEHYKRGFGGVDVPARLP